MRCVLGDHICWGSKGDEVHKGFAKQCVFENQFELYIGIIFVNKKTRTIYPGFTTIRPTTFFLYLETFLGCSFKFSGKVEMIHKTYKLLFPIGPPFFPTGLAKVPMKNVFLLIIFFVTVFLLSRDLIWRYPLKYQVSQRSRRD